MITGLNAALGSSIERTEEPVLDLVICVPLILMGYVGYEKLEPPLANPAFLFQISVGDSWCSCFLCLCTYLSMEGNDFSRQRGSHSFFFFFHS